MPKKTKENSRMATRNAYDEEDIAIAINDIKSGRRTATNASRFYNIPRSTLRDKLTGKTPIAKKMGPKTFLTDAEENLIVNHIISAQGRTLPVTKDTIMSLVSSFLSDSRNFVENNRERPYKFGRSGSSMPGTSWYRLFLKRHPDIVTRMTESLSGSSRNVNQQDVKQWFADVRSYLAEKDSLDILYEAKRNFNIDDSIFEFIPPNVSRNDRYAIADNEIERLIVLSNTGADGSLPPPLIIYPNLRVPIGVYDSLPTTLASIGKSESGQMNNDLLYEYLCGGFDEWLTNNNIQRPVIVWADRHESRMQYHLVKRLAELQIILILIPPNTSHFMQPIEAGVHAPMKKAWKKCLKDFQTSHPNECVNKENFARIFLPMYVNVMSKNKIKDAFRVCGIHPFDVEAPNYSKITQETEHSSNTSPTILGETKQNAMAGKVIETTPELMRNAATQTQSTHSSEFKINSLIGLGLQKLTISKGCDDSVLCNPRFEALLLSKREKWIQFMLEGDLNLTRSPTKDTMGLTKESKPITSCMIKNKKDFPGSPVNSNWEGDRSSSLINTQENHTIQKEKEDKVDNGELLEPSTEMDGDVLRVQGEEIVHMELLDPSIEMDANVALFGPSVHKDFSKRRKIELDPSPYLVWKDSHLHNDEWEVEKHSYPPKNSESNLERLLIQIEENTEINGKSTHFNLNENPPRSRERNIKRGSDSSMMDESKRALLKECSVSVLRLPRDLAPTDVLSCAAANKVNINKDMEINDEPNLKRVKMEKDIEIVDKPNDLNYKVDPPPSCEPKLETANYLFQVKMDEDIDIVDEPNDLNYKEDPPPSSEPNLETGLMKTIYLNKCSMPMCNESFCFKKDLDAHMEIHEPFKRSFCDKTYGIKSSLDSHVISVLPKVKPFQCPSCYKSYMQLSGLSYHMNAVHKKLKSFRCPYCDFVYGRQISLTNHIKSVHYEMLSSFRFQCPYCVFASSIKKFLTDHIEAVHGHEQKKHLKCYLCDFRSHERSGLVRHWKDFHKLKNFVEV